ncbi:MAG: helix-hairpin-helix domain-containing protein, partial [Planctomycetia bacterium]|nr:helix-hairpin-helix domain-containing protein [Planctomycetia bacterium]
AAIAAWAAAGGWFHGSLVHHDAPPSATAPFTVNVNSAGVMELSQLPGLGPATAQRIVDHRREHGPFASLDALLDVPGIGPRTLEDLRPHLRPIRSREAER